LKNQLKIKKFWGLGSSSRVHTQCPEFKLQCSQKKDLFWLIFPNHGLLAPLLWAFGEAEHHGSKK
jgi:hypothetical protein